VHIRLFFFLQEPLFKEGRDFVSLRYFRHSFTPVFLGFDRRLIFPGVLRDRAYDVLSAKEGHRQLTGIQEIREERGVQRVVEYGVIAGGCWSLLNLM